MSRHYNTRHDERGRSHYGERLIRRGVSSASVRMRSVESLRDLQLRREARTGSPFPSGSDELEQKAA